MIEVVRVEVGDEYTDATEPEKGGGCFRTEAREPGYTIRRQFSPPIFVSDRQLEAARQARHPSSGNGDEALSQNRSGVFTGAIDRIRGFLR